MSRPRMLDLFCGAGGASMGYHRAGFDVVGVDIKPQPRYPFEFHQGDATTWPTGCSCGHGLADHPEENQSFGHNVVLERICSICSCTDWDGFDAIHASPPCQAFSKVSGNARKAGAVYPDLVAPTRDRLVASGVPWIIENVPNAPMSGVVLCGSMFGLDVRRHRRFETSFLVFGAPPCQHERQTPRFRSLRLSYHREGRLATVVGVHGHIQYAGEFALRCAAMGIDWMNVHELSESIPPAYTQFIGGALISATRQPTS